MEEERDERKGKKREYVELTREREGERSRDCVGGFSAVYSQQQPKTKMYLFLCDQ